MRCTAIGKETQFDKCLENMIDGTDVNLCIQSGGGSLEAGGGPSGSVSVCI